MSNIVIVAVIVKVARTR